MRPRRPFCLPKRGSLGAAYKVLSGQIGVAGQSSRASLEPILECRLQDLWFWCRVQVSSRSHYLYPGFGWQHTRLQSDERQFFVKRRKRMSRSNSMSSAPSKTSQLLKGAVVWLGSYGFHFWSPAANWQLQKGEYSIHCVLSVSAETRCGSLYSYVWRILTFRISKAW